MIYYEIKKVFSKISNKIAIIILAIILCITISSAISGVEYVNEEGEIETGITAIRKLKEEKKKWKGELTEEQIKNVVS